MINTRYYNAYYRSLTLIRTKDLREEFNQRLMIYTREFLGMEALLTHPDARIDRCLQGVNKMHVNMRYKLWTQEDPLVKHTTKGRHPQPPEIPQTPTPGSWIC